MLCLIIVKIFVVSHVVTLDRGHANGSHYASKASSLAQSRIENEYTFPAFLLALSKSFSQLNIHKHSYSTVEDLQKASFILTSTNNRDVWSKQNELWMQSSSSKLPGYLRPKNLLWNTNSIGNKKASMASSFSFQI